MSLVCFRYAPAGMSEADIARVNAAIMEQVTQHGASLPGLYPMNEETKARYQAWQDAQS